MAQRRQQGAALPAVHTDKSLRIVSDPVWNAAAVRTKRDDNGAVRPAAMWRSGGNKSQRYLLSGLLKCGTCGSNLIVTDRYCYGCSAHRDGVACSNGVRVQRALLEERLLHERLFNLLESPAEVEKAAKELEAAYRAHIDSEQRAAAELPQELQYLNARIARLRERLRQGDPDMTPMRCRRPLTGRRRSVVNSKHGSRGREHPPGCSRCCRRRRRSSVSNCCSAWKAASGTYCGHALPCGVTLAVRFGLSQTLTVSRRPLEGADGRGISGRCRHFWHLWQRGRAMRCPAARWRGLVAAASNSRGGLLTVSGFPWFSSPGRYIYVHRGGSIASTVAVGEIRQPSTVLCGSPTHEPLGEALSPPTETRHPRMGGVLARAGRTEAARLSAGKARHRRDRSEPRVASLIRGFVMSGCRRGTLGLRARVQLKVQLVRAWL